MFNPQPYDQYELNNPQSNRVRVEDALSYLDQVKTQFAEDPAVYTQFLDIMKDFKSQQIDTPGVITRVSRLFKGRPSLITGFNTFLPPGFEVRVQGSRIIITEPSGNVQELDNESIAPFPRQHPVAVPMDPTQPAHLAQQPQQLVEGPSGTVAEEADAGEYEEATSDRAPDDENEDEPSTETTGDNQFDLALEYVNKIKARFANNPDVYKKFLDILHGYQNAVIDQSQRGMADAYIMDAVAEIFADEADLLDEFKYFLPECQGLNANSALARSTEFANQLEYFNYEEEGGEDEELDDDETSESNEDEDRGVEAEGHKQAEGSKRRKRRAAYADEQGPLFNAKRRWKKEQHFGDVIAKMSIKELSLYERMREQLDLQELNVMLRLMNMYSNGIATANEFIKMARSILKGKKELMNEIRELLGENEEPEEKPLTAAESEQAQQVDYATCRILGVSYRKIADDAASLPKCSGRTKLCNEVLNDTWASFPSWASEDSSSVSSKKTAYEEFLYRTEDERFELDILIEINKYAIEALEKVRRMVANMSAVEQTAFKLDEKLGATSGVLMMKALKRVFGEQLPKYVEMLRKKPAACVDRVVERLKEKENEWRDMQSYMNKIWREQNEKNYIRSLDHQTAAMRNNDAKWLKTKTLLHHVETLFDERQQKSMDGECEDVGPHMMLYYPEDRSILDDAMDLIIHYVKRQANIHKDEKRIVKTIMRKYVRDWFSMKEEPMSDDEEETPNAWSNHNIETKEGTSGYRLIFGGNCLFLFFRLHQFICERLGRIKMRHAVMCREYKEEQQIREKQAELYKKHGKSIQGDEMVSSDANNGLRIIKPPMRDPSELYEEVLAEIKNLLDSSIELPQFEDNIRMKFPVDGYQVFTMDKLISLIGKTLVGLANGGDEFETMKLYDKYRMQTPPSVYDRSEKKNSIEAEYRQISETKLNCKNCFQVYVINGEKPVVTIELVDTETEIEESSMTAAKDGEKDEEERKQKMEKGKEEGEKSEQSEVADDGKEGASKKKAPTKCFLHRNVQLRKAKGISRADFATFDCKYLLAAGKARMIGGTVEGLLKNKRVEKSKKLNLQKSMFLKRHERAKLLRREKGKCALLSEGSTTSRFKHPHYPWISYLVYTSKS